MDQLSAGKTKIVASYLKWMKAISIPYYQDFVEYGSKEGRDWLMDMQFADEAPPGCQELLKMDARQMNAQRGHQWVNAMAQCIQTDINLQNSPQQRSNLELSDQAGGIYGTGSRCRWGCRPNAGNNDSDAAVASIYLETSFDI